AVLVRLPDDLNVLFLPTQTIGKSNEHLRSGGTITHSADNLIRSWFEIGEGVHRAGLRKMIIVNSHGGNTDVVGIVARELRVRLGKLVGTSPWGRLGPAAGLHSAFHTRHGLHAGDIETSLILYFPARSRRHDQGEAVPIEGRRDGERLQASAPGGPARLRMDRAGHQSRWSRGRRVRGDGGERPSDRGASGRRLHRLAARRGAFSVERARVVSASPPRANPCCRCWR